MENSGIYARYLALRKEKMLSVTGHRLHKLPQGPRLEELKQLIYAQVDLYIAAGYTCIMAGMAEGVDYIIAEYACRLRDNRNPEVEVIGVEPCEDYEEFFRRRNYSLAELQHLRDVLNTRIVLPGSWGDKEIFKKRNCFMIDHAAALLAVCKDEQRSGSSHTLHYAKRKSLPWSRINPSEERYTPEIIEYSPGHREHLLNRRCYYYST